MLATKDWLVKANKAALAAIPSHLQQFVTTPEAYYAPAALPVVLGEDQWLLFAYCENTGRGWPTDPRVVYAPKVLLWIHYPSGKFRWEEPAPNSYGSPMAIPDEFGWQLGPISRWHLAGNSWHEASLQYTVLIRRVIEQGWLLTRYSITPEEQEAARALQTCTRIYYDEALLPYYRHYGSHFLAWMKRAAK